MRVEEFRVKECFVFCGVVLFFYLGLISVVYENDMWKVVNFEKFWGF